MDLEELNKTQIILLTLLVSFVTSIATGIVTVTLMDQAPPAVTQTINRVVERTVERVVPAEVENGNNEPTVIEKETTVVIKEEDLITESIEKNKATLARLVEATPVQGAEGVGSSTNVTFRGIGIFVSDDGTIATEVTVAQMQNLSAMTSNGTIYPVEFIKAGSNGIGFVRLVTEEGALAQRPFRAVAFADSSTLKLGQTVISLQGEERTNVSMGIISGLVEGERGDEDEVPTQFLRQVDTNIANSMPGSPLINIFGEVVGIDTAANASGSFTASSLVREDMILLVPAQGTVQADTVDAEG